MIYRHESIEWEDGTRPDIAGVLYHHTPELDIKRLEDIPRKFEHWNVDWLSATHLVTSGILYVYTYEPHTTILTIWYDTTITSEVFSSV